MRPPMADYFVINCTNGHGKLMTVKKNDMVKIAKLQQDGVDCPTCGRKVAAQFYSGPA